MNLENMSKGTIYKSNGEVQERTFSKENISLKDMQEVVGGFIEFLYLKNNLVMVVNEDGKIVGLPYNARATKLIKENNINDIIVGDVLVINKNLIQ